MAQPCSTTYTHTRAFGSLRLTLLSYFVAATSSLQDAASFGGTLPRMYSVSCAPSRAGRTLEDKNVIASDVRNGKFAESWPLSEDPYAADSSPRRGWI
jgi:hypothetical protein